MPGEINIYTCGCNPPPGTQPPDIAPYVVSLEGLYGIIDFGNTGAITWRTEGNTIYADFTPDAGLGSVTSVALASSNSNLTIVSGSPVTTSGTITLNLAGNIGSISGLVMAADQMIYSTGANTFVATSLTSFARTILDDANATAARSTLGLVIGTNVQAWNTSLDSVSANITWSGDDLTNSGGATFGDAVNVAGAFTANGLISGAAGGSFSGNVLAGSFTGDGSALTNLEAGDIASGTLAVARGGTNISSYAVGDLIHATGATTLTKLPSVSAGSYLRSAGVTTASVWSTLKLPNSATTGDLFYGSSSNTMGNLADVASGNVLLSGGVGVAPAYGKVTSSHIDATTIATISAGTNANIEGFSASNVLFSGDIEFQSSITLSGQLLDSTAFEGASGYILTSTGTGVLWSNQINLDTLNVVTNIGIEGTITGAGTTGAQIINKPSGTVRFAAAASSLVVTNSLCTTSHRVHATACTNDTTAYVKNVVTTNGAFTIVLGAAATAETEVFWTLIEIT